MSNTKFLHTCEVCEKEVFLTSAESFDQGWDYPPTMGAWKVVSPRTCGNCSIDKTLWWALAADKKTQEDLTPKQLATLAKIQNEIECS
jgi:hypothetical protein